MSRRREKKRKKAVTKSNTQASRGKNAASQDPKSMVIRIGAGEVGPSVSQLVKDVRSVMEPETASRLQERRSNRLRDYTAMAGPLGVTHLLLFSRSSSGNTNLRLALTPRGPTLHFRVEKYSLAKDVRKAQRHAQVLGTEHLTPPLLVMNNFITPPSDDGHKPAVPKNLESLTTSVFQSLFPAISPQTTPLSSIRRVLLLDREPAQREGTEGANTYVLNFRHYAITTKRTGLSRGLKRINAAENNIKQKNGSKHHLPNLGKLEDISDYLLNPSAATSALTSGSESEMDSDAGIEVLESKQKRVLNRKQMDAKRASGAKFGDNTSAGVEKRYVKLSELGPRMRLRLNKVEEGICDGKILWHEYINKTSQEVKEMEETWEKRKQEKDARRKAQRENVERKRAEKESNGRGQDQRDDTGASDSKKDLEIENADDDDLEDDWDDGMLED